MNPELLLFPSSLVGGRPRPHRPFPSCGDVPEADSEAVPMAPLRRLRSCFFDDGPRSEIREGDLANMRRKYVIHPSVGMSSPTEFERAPDGGAGEVDVYEAYLEAGFRGVIPSLIGGVSSFFGLCPSKLTHLTWRTLMAIQRGSITFDPVMVPLWSRNLRGVSGVITPSRGVRGNHPFRDGWNSRYVFVKIQEPVGYHTSWRTVDVSRLVSFAREAVAKLIMGAPRRFRWVTFLMSRTAFRNVARLPVSVVYDGYQKIKARKRRLSYTPPPRLARAALSANGLSSISSTSAEILPNRDLLVDAHRRLTGEEWLERRVDHWNPEEEYRRHMFLSGGLNHQSGSFSQAATPRSVVGLRFSEGPLSE
ncbi:hypothetical protein Bca101_075205 [Brassica carinata]